jgi:tetratricopeptide (TPR) repeat protein
MTSSSQRSYLRLIPALRALSQRELRQLSENLAQEDLADGESLQLRGTAANVLALVVSGEVEAEVRMGQHGRVHTRLTSGQWLGDAWVWGAARVVRTRLTSQKENTTVLLLWRSDWIRLPIARRVLVGAKFRVNLWAGRLRETLAHISARGKRWLLLSLARRPVVVGALLAFAVWTTVLTLTGLGKTLTADWRCLSAIRRGNRSAEGRWQALHRVYWDLPTHPLTNVAAGNLIARAGNLEVAKLYYERVARASGAGANNLGVVLLEQDILEQARDALLLSAELEPDVAVAYENLGIAHWRLGEKQAAVRAFKEALRIDPDLIAARYYLGTDYWERGDFVKAGASFQGIVERDASWVPAYIGLGVVYLQVEDLPGANRAFEQAVHLAPDSVAAQFYLGWTQLRRGQVVAARETFDRVRALDPSHKLERRMWILLDAVNRGDKEV